MILIIIPNITLRIKGPGTENIFYQYFSNDNFPDKIFINGIENTTIKYRYY